MNQARRTENRPAGRQQRGAAESKSKLLRDVKCDPRIKIEIKFK